MKTNIWFAGSLTVGAGAILALSFLGCESSSSSNDFNISPQDVTLVASNAPSQTFVASGGTAPYAWSLDNGTLGSLNTTTGSQVVYTATTNTGNNVLRAVDDSVGGRGGPPQQGRSQARTVPWAVRACPRPEICVV